LILEKYAPLRSAVDFRIRLKLTPMGFSPVNYRQTLCQGGSMEAKIAALVIIDMQVGLFTPETSRYDAEHVVSRINAVAKAVRKCGGMVVFIQHESPKGYAFEPGAEGWHILPSMEREPQDVVIHKTACDSFYNTELATVLERRGIRRLLVTGCATDFCVDTTVRAAMSRDYEIVVVADGHTTADRPHVSARLLIQHHNWLWRELIHPKIKIEVLPAEKLIERMRVAHGVV
jgi:nicotinamidase-related amidase